ncbi:MAG TPA: hypothetical protein EYP09_11980 [Anaerolineae bacterium]|nr:hypothetical protein [Anaerolineae bacterium]
MSFLRDGRGGIAPLIAVLLEALIVIFMLMLLGLAQLRLIRMNLYRAADLAALAGTQELDFAALIQGEHRLLKTAAEIAARATLEDNLEDMEKQLAEDPAAIAADAEIVVLNPGDAMPYTGQPATQPEVWIGVEAPPDWLGAGIWPVTIKVVVRAVVSPP